MRAESKLGCKPTLYYCFNIIHLFIYNSLHCIYYRTWSKSIVGCSGNHRTNSCDSSCYRRSVLWKVSRIVYVFNVFIPVLHFNSKKITNGNIVSNVYGALISWFWDMKLVLIIMMRTHIIHIIRKVYDGHYIYTRGYTALLDATNELYICKIQIPIFNSKIRYSCIIWYYLRIDPIFVRFVKK